MQILRLDPPPAARWSVHPARDRDGRAVLHVVPPPVPGSPWPVLELDHQQGSLRVSAVVGDLPGRVYFDLPDTLRRRPFASSVGLPRPTPETAAETAVAFLAGVCGERPAAARAHLILLSAVAALIAGDAERHVRLCFPDGELLSLRHDRPDALRRPLRLPRLADALARCPMTRGVDLDLPGDMSSPLGVPESAHARADLLARLSPGLAGGPDGLSPETILEALTP